MPCKKDVAVVRTMGIDTGKNTLHLIGLNEKGAIVLREKVSRNRIAARSRLIGDRTAVSIRSVVFFWSTALP